LSLCSYLTGIPVFATPGVTDVPLLWIHCFKWFESLVFAMYTFCFMKQGLEIFLLPLHLTALENVILVIHRECLHNELESLEAEG